MEKSDVILRAQGKIFFFASRKFVEPVKRAIRKGEGEEAKYPAEIRAF